MFLTKNIFHLFVHTCKHDKNIANNVSYKNVSQFAHTWKRDKTLIGNNVCHKNVCYSLRKPQYKG